MIGNELREGKKAAQRITFTYLNRRRSKNISNGLKRKEKKCKIKRLVQF